MTCSAYFKIKNERGRSVDLLLRFRTVRRLESFDKRFTEKELTVRAQVVQLVVELQEIVGRVHDTSVPVAVGQAECVAYLVNSDLYRTLEQGFPRHGLTLAPTRSRAYDITAAVPPMYASPNT